MIRFAHPEYLYALALIPVMILVYSVVGLARKRALSRFGSLEILSRLAESASRVRRLVKFTVFTVAYCLIVVGFANPQIGTRLQEVKQEGVDIFIALDVSLSMKAEDIRPNRLEKAKFDIRSLISRLAGDRVGLIVFAGEAYTQFPLTTDYAAANLFLDAVDVDVVPTPGTSIGAAIQRAIESFNFQEPSSKVLVIISDGEETEGDAFAAAEDAARKGILIYTIGLGSPTGSPIPIYNAGGRRVDFKRDRAGSVVLTKLDEVSLERIASIGKGRYFRGSSGQTELHEVFSEIHKLEKTEMGVRQFTDYESRFQIFLLAGFILLIGEFLISERRALWLARWNPIRKEEEANI